MACKHQLIFDRKTINTDLIEETEYFENSANEITKITIWFNSGRKLVIYNTDLYFDEYLNFILKLHRDSSKDDDILQKVMRGKKYKTDFPND